jgi:hypothetical protein
MAVPSSLFVKLSMSKKMCDKWLDAPVKFLRDYTDWPQMNPVAASFCDEWRDAPENGDFMSAREYLDAIADFSRYFCYEYDDEEGAFFIADAEHKASMAEIAATVAALRGAENFKDDDGPSFIYVFPAISGGDPEALLRIEQGSSRFLHSRDASPDVLYFVNEAEEFIETMMEDD